MDGLTKLILTNVFREWQATPPDPNIELTDPDYPDLCVEYLDRSVAMRGYRITLAPTGVVIGNEAE